MAPVNRGRRTAVAAAVLLVGVWLAAADAVDAQTDDPINTDRPGVVVTAPTLPRGVWQLETGFDYARESTAGTRTRRFSGVTTVNYGLLDGVELLLEGEPFVVLRGDEHATGLGDTFLGVKLRLLEGDESAHRPTLAILPGLKVPTAQTPIGTTRLDAAIVGLATLTVGRFDITGNAGMAALGQRDGYLLQALVVAAVQTSVAQSVRALGEVFYHSPEERHGRHGVVTTVGAVWVVTPDMALDAGVRTTISGRGPDYVLRTGISMKFGP